VQNKNLRKILFQEKWTLRLIEVAISEDGTETAIR
jgi:hypothetical protein